jgi:c-di-GMP-binding flagellar brake protein YcgR
MSRENRLDPRAVALFTAEYWLKDAVEGEQAMVRDLSATGAAILTREPLPLQREVRLRFRLPETQAPPGEPVEVTSVVVRTWETGSRDARQAYGAGLHFLDLRRELVQRIRTFVFERGGRL